MFGGLAKSLVTSADCIVAQYSGSLHQLDLESLRRQFVLPVKAQSFGVMNSQLVVLNEEGQVLYYVDGKMVHQDQVKLINIKSAYYFDSCFLLFDGKRLTKYDCRSKKQSILRSDLIGESAQLCMSADLHVAAIDKSVYVECEGRSFTYTHTREVTCVEVYDRTIALGDVQGCIYVLDSSLKVQARPPQWHAHAVNVIRFDQRGEYLYSAGKEGVLLQWHLHTQRKQFFPRQGNEILDLRLSNDKAILLLKGSNCVKSVSLSGSGQQSVYKSVHSSTVHEFAQFTSKTVLANATCGYLQLINLEKGCPDSILDICNRNFVNEIESSDVTQFQVSGKWLCCAVQLHNDRFYLSQLRFFEFDEKNQIRVVSFVVKPHTSPILGMKSTANTFMTWSATQIRLWQLRGTNWTCTYYHEFSKIRAAHLTTNAMIIVNETSIVMISTESFQVTKEVPWPKVGEIRISDTYLVMVHQNQLTSLHLETLLQKTIELKLKNIDRVIVQDKYALVVAGKLLLINLRTSEIVAGCQTSTKIVAAYSIAHDNIYDFYAVDSAGVHYKALSRSDGAPKKHSMEEEVENEKVVSAPRVDARLVASDEPTEHYHRNSLAQLNRKLKELNISSFFPQQSHTMPTITSIANRVAEYLQESAPQEFDHSQVLTVSTTEAPTEKREAVPSTYSDYVRLKEYISML